MNPRLAARQINRRGHPRCAACCWARARASPHSEGQGSGPAPARELVEIFSWWAAPGEADALEALVAAHQSDPPGRAHLQRRRRRPGRERASGWKSACERNEPPDIFQEYIHQLRAVGRHATERQMPLDDLFDHLGLRQVVFPELIHDITRDGHIFAMPVNVHRENTLFYNRRILAAHHVAVPRTVPELLAACRKLKAEGVVPLAAADQGWILRIMFNALAAGQMGGEAYHAYFMGLRPIDVAPFREAIDLFAEVVENYINADAGDDGFGWTNAAQALYDGDTAMFLHGDWVKGYLAQLGWSGETDFGVAAAPGSSDLFLYGIDAFALARGARNEAGARDFLETVASPAGQVAFNRIKGSSPIRARRSARRAGPAGPRDARRPRSTPGSA